MAKGKDTRDSDGRRPRKPGIKAFTHMDSPNVIWVNFKNPTEPHPSVIEYAENLKKGKNNE